jgi:hypothetical protein
VDTPPFIHARLATGPEPTGRGIYRAGYLTPYLAEILDDVRRSARGCCLEVIVDRAGFEVVRRRFAARAGSGLRIVVRGAFRPVPDAA